MQAILEKDRDTICALSTPQGSGGISVIRISGDRALEVAKKLCTNLPEKLTSHCIYLCKIHELHTKREIDEILLSYFAHGKSFTGEETVEISCHGSQFISQKIVNELLQAGCRHAEKGEFTYRAFINDKLDLIQAESILNLIESQSQRTANQALRQLKGDLSKNISILEEDLLVIGAHLEAQIDFVEQDIEPEDQYAL
ncbi:MAG: tRNA uridine-5-carboxymethylaminomethyl(34) synthesis GTPase MnmE, partial [Bdellovibrionales bacterium]|nr:tRNA uridine-5-carboxymethylaminomethyl(34) synthesis GTPase MnmE [Bdellovibrionales bacterium]